MTEQCIKCKQYYWGRSKFTDLVGNPFCGDCFNELAYEQKVPTAPAFRLPNYGGSTGMIPPSTV